MQSSNLAQKFNWGKLLRFSLPTILMMVSLSLYTTVDGIMVSQLISEKGLAAVNLVYPVVSLILATSLMLSSGSNAIIAYLLGEGKAEEARKKLTTTYLFGLTFAVVIMAIGLLLIKPILIGLGTSEELMVYAMPYLRTMLYFTPFVFLQIFTQTFMVTEGKPILGLVLSILSGVINIGLDYLFMGVWGWGITGAAIATGIGYMVTGLYGLLYFMFHPKAGLRFSKPAWDLIFLIKTMTNGASEMVNNVSIAFTTFLFNVTMIRLIGNEGVVAITIILYVQFIQMAIYFGYAQGVSPIISFKYGSEDREGLKSLIRKSFIFVFAASFVVIGLSFLLANPVIGLFVESGTPVFALTRQGFLITLFAYVFMGANVFMSAMFTALGNGRVSALLSFMRTFVFIVGCLILLPNMLGVMGVWIAAPISEALAFFISWLAYVRGKNRYGY